MHKLLIEHSGRLKNINETDRYSSLFSEPLTLSASAMAAAPASPMLLQCRLRTFSEALNFYESIILLY